MATSCPLNVPLNTIPNPPSPNFLLSCNSSGSNLVVISVVYFIGITPCPDYAISEDGLQIKSLKSNKILNHNSSFFSN